MVVSNSITGLQIVLDLTNKIWATPVIQIRHKCLMFPVRLSSKRASSLAIRILISAWLTVSSRGGKLPGGSRKISVI